MILVTGATGVVGRAVVQQLAELGQHVRALSRRPEDAGLPAGVEVAAGSASDEAAVRGALDGVRTAVVVLAGDVPGQARRFAAAAGHGSLRRVVLLSSAGVLHPVAHGIADDHRAAEEAIRGIGVPWTFLRPGPFHSNTTWWSASIREHSRVRCLIGNRPGAPIDPVDVAATAVAVLTQEGHEGRAYQLTGPELISSEEQTRALGELLGRELGFEVAPEDEVVGIFTRLTGDREAAVTNVRALRSAEVPWGRPLRTVREITGREPRPFRAWAAANTALFR